MIRELLEVARRPAVALSGGRDSMVVLDMVRKYQPDIEVLVFKTDFAPHQWAIVDNLIREWDLTVFSPPPRASYLVPNGDELARVDEYEIGAATLPVLRDFVHDDSRCALEMERKFLPASPLDFDLIFVGTRKGDRSEATGQPLRESVSKINGLTLAAPLFFWSDATVEWAAQGLPYAKEWYEDGDVRFDTGNLLACSRCLGGGGDEPVACPKANMEIPGVVWDKAAMLRAFREKFGFEREK